MLRRTIGAPEWKGNRRQRRPDAGGSGASPGPRGPRACHGGRRRGQAPGATWAGPRQAAALRDPKAPPGLRPPSPTRSPPRGPLGPPGAALAAAVRPRAQGGGRRHLGADLACVGPGGGGAGEGSAGPGGEVGETGGRVREEGPSARAGGPDPPLTRRGRGGGAARPLCAPRGPRGGHAALPPPEEGAQNRPS